MFTKYTQFVTEEMEITLKRYHHPRLVEEKIIPMLNLIAICKGTRKAKRTYERMIGAIPNEKNETKSQNRQPDFFPNSDENKKS